MCGWLAPLPRTDECSFLYSFFSVPLFYSMLCTVADKVVIPKDTVPGRYVLSWRMDCEETAQIWSNCADVNIVA